MSDAKNLKAFIAEELAFQALNRQNDEFVARINERLEESEVSVTKAANKVPRANADKQLEYDLKGNVAGNVTGTVTKATNVAGGAAGSIPYQTAEDTTTFLAKGTLGQIMTYGVLTEAGDTSNQLSGWSIAGATDENTNTGVLYWKLTNSGTTRTVDLYKNSDGAAGNKVATGSRTGDGLILLVEANASGLSGEVTVAYSADDTDLANNTLTIEAKPAWVEKGVLATHAWVEPGDTVLLEALTERSTSNNTGVVLKAFRILRPGQYRITFEIKPGGSAYIASAWAADEQENALTIAATHTGNTTYTAKTLDMNVPIGARGLINIRVKTNDSSYKAYIRNCRLKYTDAATTPAAVVTD